MSLIMPVSFGRGIVFSTDCLPRPFVHPENLVTMISHE